MHTDLHESSQYVLSVFMSNSIKHILSKIDPKNTSIEFYRVILFVPSAPPNVLNKHWEALKQLDFYLNISSQIYGPRKEIAGATWTFWGMFQNLGAKSEDAHFWDLKKLRIQQKPTKTRVVKKKLWIVIKKYQKCGKDVSGLLCWKLLVHITKIHKARVIVPLGSFGWQFH